LRESRTISSEVNLNTGMDAIESRDDAVTTYTIERARIFI